MSTFCKREQGFNHRIAHFSAGFTALSKPSATEIIVLSALMFDGMQFQTKATHNPRKRHRFQFCLMHHVQPVSSSKTKLDTAPGL